MNVTCNELKLKIENMKESELLKSRFNFPEFTKKIPNSRIFWKIFPLLFTSQKCKNNSSVKIVKKVRPPLLLQRKRITTPKDMNPAVK